MQGPTRRRREPRDRPAAARAREWGGWGRCDRKASPAAGLLPSEPDRRSHAIRAAWASLAAPERGKTATLADGCADAMRFRAVRLRDACRDVQIFRMILDQVRVLETLLQRGSIQRRRARALAHAGENQER